MIHRYRWLCLCVCVSVLFVFNPLSLVPRYLNKRLLQVQQRQMLLHCEHPTCGSVPMVGFPFKLNGTPQSIRRHPPRLGEHTREVLSELGLSQDEVESLLQQRVALALRDS